MSLKTLFISRLLQIFILIIAPLPILSSDQIRAHLDKHEQIDNMVYLPVVANGGPKYYLSPYGDDSNSGTSEAEAWATFERALIKDTPGNKLQPGNTLVLLDGVYTQSLEPDLIGGQPGKPITIRAQHDGQAVIDGQGIRIPVNLVDWKHASYYVIEGIVARNSSGAVYRSTADNNIFRRVSGYNADVDGNSSVFVIWANNNLIEDCVAAGTGRKMLLIFASTNSTGQNNTIRRCFTAWQKWDGRNWHDEWAMGAATNVYNGDYNTVENNISYAYFPSYGTYLLSNGDDADCIGNKVLGGISLMGGVDYQGNVIKWGNIRPKPTQYSLIRNFDILSHRSGFLVGHAGTIRDNLFQDILAWGNASVGIKVDAESTTFTNNVVNRATIYGNGLDASFGSATTGTDALKGDLDLLAITNSRIDVIRDPYQGDFPPLTGEGARLKYRYVDGVLKDGTDETPAQPLWPWPMEQRIRDELGLSVTNLVAEVIPDQVSPLADMNRPFLSVSPPVLPFGNVPLNQSSIKSVNLKNLGSGSLNVDQYQFDAQGSAQFSLVSGGTCPPLPFTLSPDQSCTIHVKFIPMSYQAQTSDLRITSPDIAPYPNPPTIYLSGIGYSTSVPIPLPGKLEAEAYTNSGGNFEVEPTGDSGGSGKISGIESGAWLEYPVNVVQSGAYDITARVASIHLVSNVEFSVSLDGATFATFHPPDTGGWESFTDITVPNVSISQGNHTLRIDLTSGSFDLNYLSFSRSSALSGMRSGFGVGVLRTPTPPQIRAFPR
jgi:hypothetical protein